MIEVLLIVGGFVAAIVALVVGVARAQKAMIGRWTRIDALERAWYVRARVGSGYTEAEAEEAERLAGLRPTDGEDE